jgi:uncharacterized 2Fe-2S/4Fe-4S cluster protein (DUF4445 family)
VKTVRFIVPGRTGPAASLLDVLRDAGFRVSAVCGGRGTCGGCTVRVDPAPAASPAEVRLLPPSGIEDGYRFACLVTAVPGMRVFMPGRDAAEPAVSVAAPGRPPAPAVQPVSEWGVSPAFAGSGGEAGLAVDLGTTTVSCALVARPGGAVLAEAAVPNGQTDYGGDVISRIEYASRGPRELARLRDAAVSSIRSAAAAACRAAGIPERALRGGAVAGNPTMIHLLVGADPTFLGRAPFRLAFRGAARLPAAAVGFPGPGDAPVAILPAGGVTLGGDVIGGAVALGLPRARAPRLLIDVGTNTELVLRVPGRGARRKASALAASAASGGAFEGAAVSRGMRAGPGAVTGAAWDGKDLRLTVSGGGPAAGLAGSGLLDVVALLRRFGILDPSGRMRDRAEAAGAAPTALAGRIVRAGSGEPAFLIAPVPGRAVLLTAGDVRQFQLAKGAIRAGIDILLSEAGIGAEDVAAVHLCGAFGTGISGESAVATGLFPAPFRGKLVRSGNSALMAAVLALRDPALPARAARFAGSLRAVSLADHPDFPSRFLASMAFPP